MAQHHLAVLVEVLAEADAARARRRAAPRAASLRSVSGGRAQVLAVEVEQVEERSSGSGRVRPAARSACSAAKSEAPLSPSTTSSPSRIASPAGSAARARGDAGAEAVGPVLAAAGEELRLAAADLRLQPVAVELDLVQPGGPRGGVGFSVASAGRHEAGEASAAALRRCGRLAGRGARRRRPPPCGRRSPTSGASSRMSGSSASRGPRRRAPLMSSQFSRFSPRPARPCAPGASGP